MSYKIAVILRHAEYHQSNNTPSAHQPYPLTPQGEKQAQAAINQLLDIATEHNAMFHPLTDSSTLLRSWETAKIITDGISTLETINSVDALCERSVGAAANLSIDEIENILISDPRFNKPATNWKSDSHYCLPFPGAESLLQAGKRVADYLTVSMHDLKLTNSNNKNIIKIFVGHGAAFRHAAYHLGILDYEQIAKLSMYYAKPIAFSVSAKNEWQQLAGDWKVRQNEAID